MYLCAIIFCMDNYQENQIMCECGKTHQIGTQNIIVGGKAISFFLESMKKNRYKKVLIISDDNYPFVGTTIKTLKSVGKEVFNIVVEKQKATLKKAEDIEDYGQDLVVAVGGEEVISESKYYCYSLDCPIIIVALNNFIDFTFSKFSRLYDGVQFEVYETVNPIEVYVPEQTLDFTSLQSYYLASKYIAVFDALMSEMVYKKVGCRRQKDFLKQTLSDYIKYKPKEKKDMWERNVWTLIRLGQAMSFYNSTICFCGGDYVVSSLMQAQCAKADFLEMNTISLKLIINAYSCFFEKIVTTSRCNINKQIQEISRLLKISPTETLKRIYGASLISYDKDIEKALGNYAPYLKGVLKKCLSKIFMITSSINYPINVLKKYNFNANRVEKSFALSPCLSKLPTTLHLIASFGYSDKLL